MPTLAELQEVVTISNRAEITNAATAFDQVVDSTTEMQSLSTHYFNIIFYFSRVVEIMDETRDANFGQNSPEAMLEYINDRAAEAATSIPTEDELGFTEPTEDEQSIPVYWFEESASGSASASTSASASGA
jgi:hypothetical protein